MYYSSAMVRGASDPDPAGYCEFGQEPTWI